MNHPAALAFILVFSSVIASSEQPPAVGAKFQKRWATRKESTLCMTQPAQLDPCVEQTFHGILYQVAYSKQNHRVTYLYTHDQKFRTVDNLKVGGSIPVSPEILRVAPGWQIRAAATRDGWWPVVGFDLPQIKLNDGTILDLSGNGKPPGSGTAVILGFSKDSLNHSVHP